MNIDAVQAHVYYWQFKRGPQHTTLPLHLARPFSDVAMRERAAARRPRQREGSCGLSIAVHKTY